MPDRTGQQLGNYHLVRLLGAGGFGEVYEADHRLLEQKRAIKLLLESHFHDPKQRERFLREARTLAALDHPNILPVLEVAEEGSGFYLVMPFYRRGTLNDLLKQRTTPLPLVEVERFLTQMCAAVEYAHTRNVVHLDLKPENILLHEDGRLVLSDFGLAHLIKQGRLEAGSSASWGTPYYMAPEHIRGEPETRSDLYALGVILYQLLTNQRPFTGSTPEAVMMKQLLGVPPPLHVVHPTVMATLEPIVQKALKKQPEERYPTVEALLADFRTAVRGSSPQEVQSSTPTTSQAAPQPQPAIVTPELQKTKLQWINDGLAHYYFSRWNEALFAFEQALRLDPTDIVAYFGKGNALWELRRTEEARFIYEQALPLVPTDAHGFYLKGAAFYYLQRHLEALAAFEQALRLAPTYAFAWNGKSYVLGELKRYAEALVASEQAIQLDPNFVRAWSGKGWVLGELKRYAEALVAYERAIQLNPNFARAWRGKGWVLGKLKRYEESFVASERAFRLDPNHRFARNNKE